MLRHFILIPMMILLFLGVAAGTTAQEPDTVTRTWREVFVTVSEEKKAVPVLDGATLGVMEQRGFAFYDDGEVATVNSWLTYETQGMNTRYEGYLLYTFRDDSTQVASFTGSGDTSGPQEGSFVFVQGTGRFTGIRGGGNFSAMGFSRKSDIYVDVVGEYIIEKPRPEAPAER